MGNDWIHCNACGRQPAQGVVFFFSNCGHLACHKCTANAVSAEGKNHSGTCPVCEKKCSFVEINRNLRPDLQVLFRNPKELATQYMKTLSQVLEFQASNRTRLATLTSEREKKAVKFAHLARDEIKRRIDLENKAVKEHMRLKCELDMERLRCRDLEAKVAEQEKQIEELQKGMTGHPAPVARSDSGIDAEMETDSGGLSFLNVATSTPIRNCSPMNRFTSTGHRNRHHISDVFANTAATLPSPITFSSDNVMTTPAMLGLRKQKHRSSSAGLTPSGRYEFKP